MKATRFPKAEVLGDIFSLAVNTQQVHRGNSRRSNTATSTQLAPQIEDMQKRYAARKRATNAMDFDDLLVLWLKLLQEHADVREHYQRRFQFILVDEYQDTNKLQSDLIDLLAARHQERHGGGRRRAKHLRLARREFPEHPQVPRALSRARRSTRSKPTTAARRRS